MDIIYTLSLHNFRIDDDTESKDVLYWYSNYLKDKEEAKKNKAKAKNKIVSSKRG